MPMGSSWLRTRAISVVFPAPDGPETMNNVPSGWKLLDILHLLAYPLDLSFQFYNERAQRRRTRLRSHGVDLPQHLLGQKIELLAGGLVAPDRLLRLLDVMRQPRQLFGDVSPFRQQNQLLCDALLAHVRVDQAGNLLYTLPEPGDHLLAELVAMLGEALLQLPDRPQPRADVGA